MLWDFILKGHETSWDLFRDLIKTQERFDFEGIHKVHKGAFLVGLVEPQGFISGGFFREGSNFGLYKIPRGFILGGLLLYTIKGHISFTGFLKMNPRRFVLGHCGFEIKPFPGVFPK